MSEMVERVARAIHEARIALAWGKSNVGLREPWPNFDDPKVRRGYSHEPLAYVDLAMEAARAAIAAMREPTKAMLDAAWDACGYADAGGLERADFEREWRSAIDAALK